MKVQTYMKIDKLKKKKGFVFNKEQKKRSKGSDLPGFIQNLKSFCLQDLYDRYNRAIFPCIHIPSCYCSQFFRLTIIWGNVAHPVESIISLVSITLAFIEDSTNSKVSTKGLARWFNLDSNMSGALCSIFLSALYRYSWSIMLDEF